MINSRFTNTGAAPVMPGFGMPPIPDSRHRRSHKHRHGKFTTTAFSHDEPMTGFTQQITQSNAAAQFSNGYGVPYGTSGYSLSDRRDLFQQEKLNQVDGFHPSGMKAKRHRRRDRHSKDNADQSNGIPEQLIGQRSSSVLGNERENLRSPFIRVDGENNSEKSGHRHKHRGRSAQRGDGYGHINEDLIFIERGDQSPHRQDPPTGYEYKGKIEVESIEKESHSQNAASFGQSQTNTASGPCPPGWQPATMPTVGTGFSSGAAVNPGGFCFGVGSASVTGGLGGFGVNPAQGQLIADYFVEPGTTAMGNTDSSNTATNTGFTSGSTQQSTTSRPKIIEVWQKRDKSGSRDSPHPGKDSKVGLEDFRSDILRAIQDLMKNQDSSQSGPQRKNNDGGTQTQIHSGQTGIQTSGSEKQISSGGEVRVIVQPIQPVFYMPRQNEGSGSSSIGPTGSTNSQLQTAGGAPKVVYVPRNVYVPVIKPVFVPRERVIVRPQVIHVARPVLVDRPVPVTQRPIIIDRERPVPVPVRSNQGGSAVADSSVVREEYVYSDNLPVAYGARCAEMHAGTNYGYVPTQHEEQYVSTSTNEVSTNYQTQMFPQNSSSNAQGIIEVLDPTVNSSWQRTDQSALFNRYGQSAASIVQKTQQVEQQMYQELRQSASSGDFQRSSSFATFSSGNGAGYGAVGRLYS